MAAPTVITYVFLYSKYILAQSVCRYCTDFCTVPAARSHKHSRACCFKAFHPLTQCLNRMFTNCFDCWLFWERVFSRSRENMHPVEKEGCLSEGAPLGGRSAMLGNCFFFFFEWENTKGSEARIKSGS